MALLDRVTTLIKANLNDLIDKAEEPEKLLKQLLLDMQNQYMQVKTQVAIAIADQHLLGKKQQENVDLQKEWLRKAELALQKNDEDLARAAIERSMTYDTAARNFSQQLDDQTHSVQMLRDALHRLEHKMAETKAKTELLIAQHRRAKLAKHAGVGMQDLQQDATFDRARLKVAEAEANGLGQMLSSAPGLDQRMAALEKSDQIDRLLAELKGRTLLLPK